MAVARRCVPCRNSVLPLDPAAVARHAEAVPRWTVAADGRSLSRRFGLPDFDTAFALVQRVAVLASFEDHHPDIAVGWGYAAFTLTTHAIGGLHANDFIIAGAIDGLAD